MFYYPHLFRTPKFPYRSHLYVGVVQIEIFCHKSLEKLTEGRNTFLGFCDLNETLVFMSKFSMEAYLEINYELVFQIKEVHIFSYHVPEIPEVLKKIDFWYFKVQVSKWTWIENFEIFGFF